MLLSGRTSTRGGSPTRMDAGLKGRVCHKFQSGFCCVRFEGIGCRKVHERHLAISSEPAPQCDASCSSC